MPDAVVLVATVTDGPGARAHRPPGHHPQPAEDQNTMDAMPDKVVEQPRPITHVGVTVTDADAAVEWYQRVLGFQLLHGPVEYTAGQDYFGRLVADMLGPKVVRGRIAMMDSGNGIGLELFEFSEPTPDRREAGENREFYLHRTGTFHFCVVDPDVAGLARRIVESGGRQLSAVWEFAPGVGFDVCYCEDPFGNIVEIYSHGTAHIWSTLAQLNKKAGAHQVT